MACITDGLKSVYTLLSLNCNGLRRTREVGDLRSLYISCWASLLASFTARGGEGGADGS